MKNSPAAYIIMGTLWKSWVNMVYSVGNYAAKTMSFFFCTMNWVFHDMSSRHFPCEERTKGLPHCISRILWECIVWLQMLSSRLINNSCPYVCCTSHSLCQKEKPNGCTSVNNRSSGREHVMWPYNSLLNIYYSWRLGHQQKQLLS